MRVKEAIIVEGTYDKIKLDSILSATVITADGFSLFSDKEKKDYIKDLAKKCGIIVFTDSDRAGFLIRNHIKGFVHEGKVLHAYIPDIKGKEKRKSKPSKEGFLGVEGVNPDIIKNAIIASGATVLGEEECKNINPVTLTDFYEDMLCGAKNSRERRIELSKILSLPKRISTHALLAAVNTLYGYEKYKEAVALIDKETKECLEQ